MRPSDIVLLMSIDDLCNSAQLVQGLSTYLHTHRSQKAWSREWIIVEEVQLGSHVVS